MQAGYFIMDDSKQEYKPHPSLTAFLETHSAPVYIGFGSLVYSNPEVCRSALLGLRNVCTLHCHSMTAGHRTCPTRVLLE